MKDTQPTEPRRDTLSCRRCDYQLALGQHDIFLVKHLHDAHGLTVHDGAAELRVIREGFNAGHSPATRIAALEAENVALREFARALLARLSYDYGDSEDCPAEVEKLFEIGEELFPIEGEA